MTPLARKPKKCTFKPICVVSTRAMVSTKMCLENPRNILCLLHAVSLFGRTPKPWNSDVVTSKWPTPWGNFVCLFFSSVHDHSNSHCFMKVLDGCLKETLYDWPSQSEPEKPLVQTRVSYAEKEQVVYINGTGNSTSGFLPTSLDRHKYTNRRAGVQRDGWMWRYCRCLWAAFSKLWRAGPGSSKPD